MLLTHGIWGHIFEKNTKDRGNNRILKIGNTENKAYVAKVSGAETQANQDLVYYFNTQK
jgi:hypothetical protein